MVWLKKSRALGKQDKKSLFKKSWDTLLTGHQKCGIMNTVKRESKHNLSSVASAKKNQKKF
jgi:hypothetical protein